MPDVEAISGGKFNVPHFTGKAKIDRVVKDGGFENYTFVIAPFYYQNLAGALAPQKQADGSMGWALPLDPTLRVIHMGDINELGNIVAGAFAHPDEAGNGQYLPLDHDFAAVVRAIEIARELGSQHAFDNLRESELIPGPKASADDIREIARLASASFGHAVGTCKMGVDKLAVVDAELRVHGILGLRVADASVMPQIITGPGTNASTHMIAGRAAKLILG